MPGRPRRRARLRGEVVEWRGHPGKEPFPEGNTVSLVHGLYSKRVRGALEENFATALREAMTQSLHRVYDPVLDEHAIRRAARSLALVEIIETQLDEHGIEWLTDKAARLYSEARNGVDRYLVQLGMTPAARAKLGVDVAKATDIIAALDHKRRLRDREERGS